MCAITIITFMYALMGWDMTMWYWSSNLIWLSGLRREYCYVNKWVEWGRNKCVICVLCLVHGGCRCGFEGLFSGGIGQSVWILVGLLAKWGLWGHHLPCFLHLCTRFFLLHPACCLARNFWCLHPSQRILTWSPFEYSVLIIRQVFPIDIMT